MPDIEPGGIESTPSGVLLRVYVTPRSSANKVVGVHNGEIKVALTSPPVEGEANRALVQFLAKILKVPRTTVRIESGQSSRHKVMRVQGVEEEEALRLLGLLNST